MSDRGRKLWPYYVIKYLQKPFEDIDDYVCIPRTWISRRNPRDRNKVLVSDPSVPYSTRGTYSSKKSYLAVMLYGTDSYENGKSFIKNKISKRLNGEGSSNMIQYSADEGQKIVKSGIDKTNRTQSNIDENDPAESSENERKNPITLKIKRAVVSDSGHAKKRSKHTFVSEVPQTSQTFTSSPVNDGHAVQHPDGDNYETITQVTSATKSSEDTRDRLNSEVLLFVKDMHTALSGLCKRLEEIMKAATDLGESKEILSPSTARYTTSDVKNIDEGYTDEQDEQNHDEDGQNDENESHHDDTDIERDISVKKHPHIYIKKIIQRAFDKILPAANDSCEPSSDSPVLDNVTKSEETYEDDTPAADEDDPEDESEHEDTNMSTTTNSDSDDTSDTDFEEDKKYKVPVKKRQKPTFVLPPEYDENDSRWTLKHVGPSPELVELIKKTGVYIKATSLSNCIETSQDYRTLARKLLLEIFNVKALRVCTFTGVKMRGIKRPGLDEHARSVLLRFVINYGRQNDWEPQRKSSIVRSMTNKMLTMRVK